MVLSEPSVPWDECALCPHQTNLHLTVKFSSTPLNCWHYLPDKILIRSSCVFEKYSTAVIGVLFYNHEIMVHQDGLSPRSEKKWPTFWIFWGYEHHLSPGTMRYCWVRPGASGLFGRMCDVINLTMSILPSSICLSLPLRNGKQFTNAEHCFDLAPSIYDVATGLHIFQTIVTKSTRE